MIEMMNYYFEVWMKNESFRKKITKEEAYGILHMYKLSDEDWKREEICVLSSEDKIYSLVKSTRKYDCNV